MFNDMMIYIPTRGRPNDQITLNSLTPELKKRTRLLINHDEIGLYKDYDVGSIYLPDYIKDIGGVRQWAVSNSKYKYVFLLDDDMGFFKRLSDSKRLKRCTGNQLNEMFEEFLDWLILDSIPVVGMSMRQGNNHVDLPYVNATRQMGFHGIDTEEFKNLKLRFDKQAVMEDFYMVLSLLTKGISNRVMYKYCWDQAGSNTKGGCSSYRTGDIQKNCAENLVRAFPDFVTVVEKSVKHGWQGLKTRHDVRIQWKKAFNYGVSQNI